MMLTNGNINKVDMDTVLNTDTKKRSLKQNNVDERQNNSSFSLNELEVIPQVKEINKKNSDMFTETTSFRPPIKIVNKACNGEIKRKLKKSTDSDNDVECSDSEQSSISGDLNQDSSPKTIKVLKSDTSHNKLYKDEQALR